MSEPSVLVVLWAFYPLWLVAGWLDYRQHSGSDAGRMGGVREAALHLAMLLIVALGIAATLAWLPSYTLLLGLVALALGYMATTTANPRWVDSGARVGPVSRLASRLFEFLPALALALYMAEHWPRLDLLATPGWVLAWRDPALPAGVWLGVFVPLTAFAIAPGLAELRRAWLARPVQLA
jgi:hypothetical protein